MLDALLIEHQSGGFKIDYWNTLENGQESNTSNAIANIPVLGDSEKVVACNFEDSSKIEIVEGSIDTPAIQKSIVSIMEGGEEAFNRRKDIYNIWRIK